MAGRVAEVNVRILTPDDAWASLAAVIDTAITDGREAGLTGDGIVRAHRELIEASRPVVEGEADAAWEADYLAVPTEYDDRPRHIEDYEATWFYRGFEAALTRRAAGPLDVERLGISPFLRLPLHHSQGRIWMNDGDAVNMGDGSLEPQDADFIVRAVNAFARLPVSEDPRDA